MPSSRAAILTPSPMRSPSLSSTTFAHVNADAKIDAPVLRHAGVALDHRVLNFDRAAYRVDDAAKFDDRPVARALDHPALVHGDRRIDEIAAQSPEPRQGAVLVRAGQPTEPNDVCGEDRREFPVLAHGSFRRGADWSGTRPVRGLSEIMRFGLGKKHASR